MPTGSELLYLSAATQLLLTTFLVVLLWALYTRLQKFEFFRWWAWAWTAFAVFLGCASISMLLGPVWTVGKVALILGLIVAGFLEPLLLVFGGLSWQAPGQISRRFLWAGLVLVGAAAAISFALSFALRGMPLASFAIRNVPRTFAQVCALAFCCTVFWREFRRSGSYAALITGLFCLSYSVDQFLYFASFSEMLSSSWKLPLPAFVHALGSLKYIGHSGLLFLDLADTCGICLGMIVLLVERYQRTETELKASERERLGLAVNNASLQFEIETRQRIEQELRRSEEFNREIVRKCPVAMIVVRGQDEKLEIANENFVKLFGYSREELSDVSTWWPKAYPDAEYSKTVQEKWKKLIDLVNQDSDRAPTMEATVRCKDGTYREVEFHVSRERDVYLVSFLDLTEWKRALENLQKSEKKFRLVADAGTTALWMLQEERFVYFNQEFERLTGYSREEILTMNPFDLVAPEFRAENVANARARLAGISVAPRYQFAIVTKNGQRRWLDFSAAVTEFNGKPAILASALDITAARRAEQELHEHAMYMDALIANVPLGIVIKDENQLVRFCNPAFEQMFQYEQAEIQGRNLDEMIAPHDREEAEQLSEAVQQGGVVHTVARRRRKDGNYIDVEVHGVKVLSETSFVGAFAIYQDITERKRAEEKLATLRNRLVRAQEEERARIARDLHDDAGQRLALLSIDLEQLKQASMKVKSSLTEQLEALVKVASEITSDVHNVSRRLHPSQVELLGLGAALSNFCRDFGAHNGMEIEFTDRGNYPKPPQAAALCLFRVAQEAVRNVQKHSGARHATVQLDEMSGSMRLRVSDDGQGFDTSTADYAQGLGLLSMEERLHSLGGELFIHSRPGGGTCVEACIPLRTAVPAD